MEKIEGKVWKFRDSIDTDVIIAGRYLRTFSLDDLASHVMEAEDPKFAEKVQKGDIIVAGWNFGCGSSREQAPVALKHVGVSAIIAKSFARIFYRNAINIGLPVITADVEAESEDIMCIDLENGVILNKTSGNEFKIKPFDQFMLDILNNGGLVKHYLKANEE
ncbi:homoaconitase small subunit [Methanobacterium spitsbergense]|uniref:Methanogen homoaconitase small subunit n=1 Tax=Methanobacterium spitsbergense TaxID=2874285 RepID=A0A8T5UXA6_9EURY|nr:homoaconitase small subunit [Methanobacterium spitsbergense]MBZ2165810.1 3-isopropylmalate dehydratase small subunit [Methanobacterium spitsbergense]